MTTITGEERIKQLAEIEVEVAKIFATIGAQQQKLAELVEARDILLRAKLVKNDDDDAGTVIAVPAAEINIAGKV